MFYVIWRAPRLQPAPLSKNFFCFVLLCFRSRTHKMSTVNSIVPPNYISALINLCTAFDLADL